MMNAARASMMRAKLGSRSMALGGTVEIPPQQRKTIPTGVTRCASVVGSADGERATDRHIILTPHLDSTLAFV